MAYFFNHLSFDDDASLTSCYGHEQAQNNGANNVFGNKLLLEKIFEQLELEDSPKALTVCRLVCKDWKLAATKRLKKQNWRNCNFLDLSDDEKLKKYLDVFGSPENMFFGCYKIEQDYPRGIFQDRIHGRIFQTQPQGIKSLSLAFHFNSRLPLEKVLKTQSNSLEALKILIPAIASGNSKNFKLNTSSITTRSRSIQNFKLIKLNYLCLTLGKLPFGSEVQETSQYHMLELILSKIPEGRPVKICLMQWVGIEETIALLQKYNQLTNLKILGIMKLGFGELKLLGETGIQLQYLVAEPTPIYTSIQSAAPIVQEISEFLITQAKNLEALSWGSKLNYFKFPVRMEALKKLKLRLEITRSDAEREFSDAEKEWNLYPSPILYEYYFPRLEDLELISDYESLTLDYFQPWFLGPQVSCTSLRKLVISIPNAASDILKLICQTFPLIQSLTIQNYIFVASGSVEYGIFSELWTADFAATIQEFSIEFVDWIPDTLPRFYQLDKIFSGVHEAGIAEVCGLEMFHLDFIEEDEDQDPSHCPSIFNFKNLKKLIVTSTVDDQWDKGCFTDFSAYCIFGRMESLEFLHLDEELQDFDDDALEYMRFRSYDQIRISSNIPRPDPEKQVERVFQTGFAKNTLPYSHAYTCPESEEPKIIGPPDLDLENDLTNLLDWRVPMKKSEN